MKNRFAKKCKVPFLAGAMSYTPRITDIELKRKLKAAGAVLIRGAKACGKTESGKQFAGSVLNVDRDPQVPAFMETAPERLLLGKTPRLIDEWQEQPRLWDFVRHEVDARKKTAQFILAGSATPEEQARMHSGAGRFTVLNMRTLSWQELGFSSGAVSMAKLFAAKKITAASVCDEVPVPLDAIAERLVIGGFPGLLGADCEQAAEVNRAYIDLVAEVDMSRVSNTRRDPRKVHNLLRSLARNSATITKVTTFAADIREHERAEISRPTLSDYLDALNRLFVTEEQPAWDAHIRSSASLRKTPKRHFSDPCLAVAALGADKKTLLDDLLTTGFLFESLATHELRVYAQANDASVSYFRDSTGLEVDAIVHKRNGDWLAFEIKLGTGQIDAAAANLKKFASILDPAKNKPAKALNILVGTGVSYTRPDGINVISIGSLGQ